MYQKPLWKVALVGMLAGASIYAFPFLLPALAFIFLAGLVLRTVFGFGHRHGYRHAAWTERWKTMTEEERKAFTEKFGNGCYGYRYQPVDASPSTPKQ